MVACSFFRKIPAEPDFYGTPKMPRTEIEIAEKERYILLFIEKDTLIQENPTLYDQADVKFTYFDDLQRTNVLLLKIVINAAPRRKIFLTKKC